MASPVWRAAAYTGLAADSRYGLHVSAQRARSAVEASHRSVHPGIPGVPWWAALLIAVSATAIGFAIDAGSGHKELTHVFAGFYIAGCVAAVLAVRQDGIFTAVIQPPLILFCAVPGAYWMFHGRKVGHLKDLLINCGYPLIERFPLMLGTAGGVLLVGLARWYFGVSRRTGVATPKGDTETGAGGDAEEAKPVAGGIVAKLQSMLRRDPDDEDADEASPADAKRDRVARRAEKARQKSRARSTARGARTHSRHGRPPADDALDAETERPRRQGRKGQSASRGFDPADPDRRSRRPRPPADPERGQAPRGEPRPRRSPYERPAPRGSRFDGYDRYDRYDPYDSYEPPRRRPTPRGANGADPMHHPISQVRYRGAPPRNELRDERPGRSRAPGRANGRPPAQPWEYDG